MTTPWARRETLDPIAGTLAMIGASLGLIAAVIDIAVGPLIRDWVGNKLDTTRLGLSTLLLSAIALGAAIAWQLLGKRGGGFRLATVLALLVPAGICFTTIGRFWYLPGALLIGAAVLIVASSTRSELVGAINAARWLRALIVVLGAYYLFLGLDALGFAGALGIIGALLVWLALIVFTRSHALAVGLLVLGALPFAIATWWSIVAPLVAVLMLVIGVAAMRAERSDRSVISTQATSR